MRSWSEQTPPPPPLHHYKYYVLLVIKLCQLTNLMFKAFWMPQLVCEGWLINYTLTLISLKGKWSRIIVVCNAWYRSEHHIQKSEPTMNNKKLFNNKLYKLELCMNMYFFGKKIWNLDENLEPSYHSIDYNIL